MSKLRACKKVREYLNAYGGPLCLFVGLVFCMNESDAWWLNGIGLFVFAAGARTLIAQSLDD